MRPWKTLSDHELAMLYEGLLAVLCSDQSTTRSFHNDDPGHPVYMSGASGKLARVVEYADGPKKNVLFRLGHAMHLELSRREIDPQNFAPKRRGAPFEDWQSFCRMVIQHRPTKIRRSLRKAPRKPVQ